MGKIVGALAMSHGPQLIMAPEKWPELPDRSKGPFNPKPGIEADITREEMIARHGRCHAALGQLRDQLAAWKPDVVVVVGDDQHENVFDDNQPPFLIYMGEEVDATLHFLYLGETAEQQMTHYKVAAPLARRLVDKLMDEGFDPAWSTKTRDGAGLGHAFGRSLKFLMPHANVPILPIMMNTYFPPAPSARRCLQFGAASRNVLEATSDNSRIVVLASGGLSHFIIDEDFDAAFIGALERRDLGFLGAIPPERLRAGTSEILTWITVAGAMPDGMRKVDYIPCYRNAKGIGCAMGFGVWE